MTKGKTTNDDADPSGARGKRLEKRTARGSVKAQSKADPKTRLNEDTPPEEEERGQVRRYRERQGIVRDVIEATFGELGKSNPELWERRAYLALVGLVYGTLVQEVVRIEEWVALGKLLAEGKRAHSRDREEADKARHAIDTHAELPATLESTIQELYGVARKSETDS
jgi:hypothetical protein